MGRRKEFKKIRKVDEKLFKRSKQGNKDLKKVENVKNGQTRG